MSRPASRELLVGRIALTVMTLLLIVVVGRVAQVQLRPAPSLSKHLSDRTSKRIEPAARGDLRDRRGRLIASTSFGFRAFVDPARFPTPPDAAIVDLAAALGVEPTTIGPRIVERLARNERRRAEGRGLIRYVSISGPLDDWQVESVRALGAPGVHLERIPVRRMVEAPVAASLSGVVGVDHDGLLGAELTLDTILRPSPGELVYTRDAMGRALWVDVGSYIQPTRGEDAFLSVDLSIQQIAIEELERGVREADAAGGRVVVLDPHTGDILAMADIRREIPDAVPFDALLIDRETGRGPRFDALPPDPGRARHPALGRNRCVEDAYEPGSTFKPFVWAAVTELGLAQSGEMFNTHKGRWRTPYGRPLEDVTPRDEQTWREVLVNSSNIGMAQGVARMTAKQLRDAVLKLGFGRPTGVGLPGESAGIVTSARDWTAYTQTSVAMGYEVAVTPLQMVRAYSVFARIGELAGTLPTLRLALTRDDEANEGLIVRVFPRDAALAARRAMRGVVERMDDRMWTLGRYDHRPRYDMFGKSGTANIPRPDGRGYIEGQYISSFIAGAPVDHPRIVTLVVIDDPGPELRRSRTHYGSSVAGPVVRRIVERALPYLGVAPTETLTISAATYSE